MSKIRLDPEALVVTTFAVDAPRAIAPAALISEEITDCTCQPYFCLPWPTRGC